MTRAAKDEPTGDKESRLRHIEAATQWPVVGRGLIAALLQCVYLLWSSLDQHWVVGSIIALSVLAFVFLAARDLVLGEVRSYPFAKWVRHLGFVVVGTVAFALVSFQLVRQGWASFTATGEVTPLGLILYFVWLLLDLIPLLEIPATLSWPEPLRPNGLVAGIPVLLFKVLVVLGVFEAVAVWFGQWRRDASPSGPTGTT